MTVDRSHRAPAPGSAAWLEGLLQAELGPGATLGSMAFEGRLVRIERARIPVGRHASIGIAGAVLELGAGAPLGALPLSARLLSLRGTLHVPGRAIPFGFEAAPSHRACWARGTLHAGSDLSAEITVAPGEGDRIAAHIVLSSARTRLILTGALDARARIHGGHITGRLASADLLALLPNIAVRPVAAVDVDLAAEGTLSAPRLHGRASSASVLLPPLHVEHASAAIDADIAGLRYRDLACTVRGVSVTGWGELPFGAPRASAGPLLAARVERAGPALLAVLASLASVPEPGLLPDVVLDGEAAIGPTGAATGALTLATPRSAIDLRLALGPAGELLGSTLRGTLAAADAFALARGRAPWTLPPELLRTDPATVVALDLRLAGTLARPGVAGRVAAARAAIDAGGGVALAIEDASVLLDAGPDRIAWQRLVGRFCGGVVSSAGHVAIGRGGGALDAEVAWRGVRVQDLPMGPPGERAVASVLRGVSSGVMRFERRGLAGQALAARGSVTIASPVYRFARNLTPALGRYGLPPIRARGEGPLTASVRLEDGELIAEPLTAAVDAAELTGALRLRPNGRLLGRLRVHLRAHYLAGSPILAVPAALVGKVIIPVDLAGTLGDPELRTDALEILDGLLAQRGRRGVGGAVRGVIDGLRNAARPRRRR